MQDEGRVSFTDALCETQVDEVQVFYLKADWTFPKTVPSHGVCVDQSIKGASGKDQRLGCICLLCDPSMAKWAEGRCASGHQVWSDISEASRRVAISRGATSKVYTWQHEGLPYSLGLVMSGGAAIPMHWG